MNNQEIVDRLDILIALMIPQFEPSKYPIKGTALDILRLADAEHTREDIIKKLKKSKEIIDPTLSKLRSMGLVKSISRNSKTYYIRLL